MVKKKNLIAAGHLFSKSVKLQQTGGRISVATFNHTQKKILT